MVRPSTKADMMPTLEGRAALQVDGAQTYVAGQQLRLRLNDVTPLEHGHTFVRAIRMAFDVVFEHDAGAPVLMPELVIPRIIDSVQWRLPGGHVLVDLDQQAGRQLVFHEWMLTGRYPEVTQAGRNGTVSLTNGTTTTARLKLAILLMAPDLIEPDDLNIALADLRGSQIEMRWANAGTGGIFDSGANNERVTAATTLREAVIELVARHSYRVGAYPTIGSVQLSGTQEHLPLNDCRLHYLMEYRDLADGITERFLTDAIRDRVRVRIGNKTPVDRIDIRDLVTAWNAVYAKGADDRLDQVETNTVDFAPIIFGQRLPRKVTQAPLIEAQQPRVLVEGDTTITQPQFLYMVTRLNKLPTAMQTVRKAGVAPPSVSDDPEKAHQMFEPATFGKVNVGKGPAGIQSFPLKLSPSGDERAAGTK